MKDSGFIRLFLIVFTFLQGSAILSALGVGIFMPISVWTMFFPLFPFVLTGSRIFNTDAYPTPLGWEILVVIHFVFSCYVALLFSPMFRNKDVK